MDNGKKAKFVIVAFGDSITRASIGIEPDGKNWTTIMGEKLGDDYEVVNAGFNGNSAREAMARYQKDVLAHDPDVVLLEFGGNNNDPWNKERQVGLPEFEKHLADFRAGLPQKTKVVVITFPPIITEKHAIHQSFPDWDLDRNLEPYRDITRKFAADNQYVLFDLHREMYPQRYQLILDDGVHINQQGQYYLADKLIEVMKKEGIIK